VRQLDDEELDSGDDEGRHDREAQYGEDAEEQMVEQSTMELEFGKHGIPEPSDGEVCPYHFETAQRSCKLTSSVSSTYSRFHAFSVSSNTLSNPLLFVHLRQTTTTRARRRIPFQRMRQHYPRFDGVSHHHLNRIRQNHTNPTHASSVGLMAR